MTIKRKPRIYMAGKVSSERTYRDVFFINHDLPNEAELAEFEKTGKVADGRIDFGYEVTRVIFGDYQSKPIEKELTDFVYVGPYYIVTYKPKYDNTHGIQEGMEGIIKCESHDLGGEYPSCISDYNKVAIAVADIIVAVIKEADLHGTILELGYAMGLGKPIYYYISPDLANGELWFIAEWLQHYKPRATINLPNSIYYELIQLQNLWLRDELNQLYKEGLKGEELARKVDRLKDVSSNNLRILN